MQPAIRFILYFFIFPAFFLVPSVAPVYAQDSGDTAFAQIRWQEKDSLIQFQSRLRPLRQIAGAPEAFYTYFWEFGDGTFSFDEQPEHVYPSQGTYDVRLFATNNYDDGKAPPARPHKIKVPSGNVLATNKEQQGFFKKGQALQLKVNRMPKPGEELVCIIGYQNPNPGDGVESGSLVFFYNEKEFKKKNFGLTDLRNYHEERTSDMDALLTRCGEGMIVPVYALNERPAHGPNNEVSLKIVSNTTATNLLLQKQHLFGNENIFHFDGLKGNEQRYIFAVLHTTPEMIKDTNATVTLSAMMIPDDPASPIQETNLELQIVASHDPNRMMLSNRLLNYRFLGQNRQQNYTVQFQNTGKGPAHTVDIGIKTPPIVEPGSLTIKEWYPDCIPCTTARPGQSCLDTLITKDSIHFIFKNIYLPGIRQKGVSDKDSTKGFVKYRMKFREKPQKLPFWSQADIVFDRNKPVYTNKMHTRFRPGISPAIIAGYQWGLKDPKESPFVIGASIAPYSPYKMYFQAEVYLGLYGTITSSSLHPLAFPRDTVITDNSGNRSEALINKEGTLLKKHLISLNVIPVEVRKNLKNWIGIGGGLWLEGNLYKKNNSTPQQEVTNRKDGSTLLLDFPIGASTIKKGAFSEINPGVFLDVNIGSVRVGPSVGTRFVRFFSPDKSGLMLYATWRL